MLKPIIKSLIKAPQKAATTIKGSFLERRMKQVDALIEQKQAKNLPVQSELKYKGLMEKKLETLSKKPEENK